MPKESAGNVPMDMRGAGFRVLPFPLGLAVGALAILLAVALPDDAASTECEETSIRLLTARENPSLDARTAVVVASGPIAPPMLDELERLRDDLKGYDTIILDLDSAGGLLSYTEEVLAVLQSIRSSVELNTYVRHGSECLSACVLVFLQGEQRIAGGASAWLFHGVCHAFTDVPTPKQTERFVALMAAAGVSESFLSTLVDNGYLSRPGEYWLSGYELYHVHQAGMITRLLDPWRPRSPTVVRPPADSTPID